MCTVRQHFAALVRFMSARVLSPTTCMSTGDAAHSYGTMSQGFGPSHAFGTGPRPRLRALYSAYSLMSPRRRGWGTTASRPTLRPAPRAVLPPARGVTSGEVAQALATAVASGAESGSGGGGPSPASTTRGSEPRKWHIPQVFLCPDAPMDVAALARAYGEPCDGESRPPGAAGAAHVARADARDAGRGDAGTASPASTWDEADEEERKRLERARALAAVKRFYRCVVCCGF